ncbi:NIF domain protein [Sporothrix brasiliensis 5110]|uniref:NIF domain protein n=1 Tax=Sporothrix brasiliensis 5110 TaxID=1398154 RepID=A0A0C2IM43_9PEZI|nr:NIF domain protein [Sporothrix brasiliensis 5110]KIH88065.1 NIF domain protein [Sporothrix brasiliensis 5110]
MAGISDETTPLIPQKDMHGASTGAGSVRLSKWRSLPKRLAVTVWNSIHWVLQTLAAPGVYLIACLYDENGRFSPLGPFKLLFGQRRGKHGKSSLPPYSDEKDDFTGESDTLLKRNSTMSATSGSGSGRLFSSSSMPSGSSYAVSSESESDFDTKRTQQRRKGTSDSSGRRGTAGSRSGEDDGPGTGGATNSSSNRRSVRIKLNDDTLRQRKHRKGQSSSSTMSMQQGGNGGSRADSFDGDSSGGGVAKDILAQLKSPTSPAGALTKYPRTPAPPRPLIPRRQPSFLNIEPQDKSHQKTLILDLDETLIHSMSKGGRMSTGHMVEVRLNTTFVGIGGQPSAGPQHPILYYVHKRPYCDEFLRRVCKWYNLVVFTASVQEYADPVIDWLESERKFFSARYYRQHCTFRHGAFIKDLSAVEPDLSKVMILDNSPLSYMFHQDNAIPIQGWISDHTDNDLLHLVPLLEGLQYVSDVRALLALRGGEDGRHMA